MNKSGDAGVVVGGPWGEEDVGEEGGSMVGFRAGVDGAVVGYWPMMLSSGKSVGSGLGLVSDCVFRSLVVRVLLELAVIPFVRCKLTSCSGLLSTESGDRDGDRSGCEAPASDESTMLSGDVVDRDWDGGDNP